MRKTILLSVAAAAAAAITVGVVFARDKSPSPPQANLGVFEHPQRDADRLPVAFTRGPIGTHFRNSNSRRVGSYHGTTWYVVPGRHHTVCLAGIEDGQTFGPCSVMDGLARRPILFGRATGKLQDGPDYEFAGLANDGLTRVRYPGGTTKIRNNAFFFTVPKSTPVVKVRLTGANVPAASASLPLGEAPTK